MSLAEQTRWIDTLGQAQLVARGEITAVELVDAAARRMEQAQPLNAVVLDLVEQAHERARGPMPAGPHAGVPILLKDLGSTLAGVPETMGSRALQNWVPTVSSPLVQSYLDAGLLVVGKTNTPEFGNYATTESEFLGPARNPWDLGRTTGGSSGGSAAAVAAGVVSAASGGDGTGSIRIPAACCGVVGLKPARGRAPTGEGAFGLVATHALTRTVRDSAALLDTIARTRLGEPCSALAPAGGLLDALQRPLPRLRILLAIDPPFPGAVDPLVRTVVERAATLLGELGHEIVQGTPGFPDATAVRRAVAILFGVGNLAEHRFVSGVLGRPPADDELEPVTWQMVRLGEQTSALELADAVDELDRQARGLAESCAGCDVLLCPSLNVPPPPLGTLGLLRDDAEAFLDDEFAFTGWTAAANVTGWGAISVPLGEGDGLPVGVQMMAPRDDVLLALAAELEQAAPWEQRHPPVSN